METLMQPQKTKANKEHRCDFCNGKINKGDKYLKSTHKSDGDIYDWKTHDYCSELASKMKMYDDADEGVTQEMFMENVSEAHYSFLTARFAQNERRQYSDILNQLRYVNFREKLHYVIMHYKELEKENTSSATNLCEDCKEPLTGGYEVKCGKCWITNSNSHKPF